MRPLGFSALWALAQLCVFVHEAKANASDQLLFDAAACTSIRTKAIDTLQRLSTETDEGVDFIDSMARSWREFLLVCYMCCTLESYSPDGSGRRRLLPHHTRHI
jgi:hypothetical protein